MAHYAFLTDNIVTEVIVGIDETELIEQLHPEIWYGNFRNQVCKRTSYNTIGGIYYNNGSPSEDQSKAFRKNFAGIGYYYDEQKDAFIPPKPFPSWILNDETCLWDSPVDYPNTTNIPIQYRMYNIYIWNEINYYWELKTPNNSWTLHEDSYYISPIPYPNDGNYYNWDESILDWVLL
jgi:hypothetical protein